MTNDHLPITITEGELRRLRLIEEAYRLLVAADDREVADMSLREWTRRMNAGRVAVGAESWQ